MSYAPAAWYMAQFGSTFARYLGSAWLAADEESRCTLEQGFAVLFSHYRALALTRTEAA